VIDSCGFNAQKNKTKLDLTRQAGVRVGQVDINEGDDVHTGVTVIFPRGVKNTSYVPCYAAVHDMNGIGEWTGLHQIREWGFTRAVRTLPQTTSNAVQYVQ
jgi:D-aminopeptidase